MLQEILQQELPTIAYGALRMGVIFIIALGTVYILGRMLEIVNSNRGRNMIALLTIFPAAYFSVLIYDLPIIIHPWEIYWRMFVYASGAAVMFVLLGWRLFDRVDYLLDKKIAPDDGEPKESPKKRRTK